MKKLLPIFFIASILITSCAASVTSVTSAPPPAKPAESESAPQAVKTPKPKSTLPAQSNLRVEESALRGLEISVWHPWYGLESSLFNSLAKTFNEENEWGIKVTAQEFVNYANLYESVNAALPAKEKPNMVIALPEHAIEWHQNQTVRDLTTYINDPVYGMSVENIPALFMRQDNLNGKQIAMPAQRTARFLLWNETWAKELGFSSAPATPEAFRRQACAAQQAMMKDNSPQNDFKGGWLVDTDPMTAYSWMTAFGGGVMEGGDYRFLTPQNIEAFKFLRELSESNCAWQGGENPSNAFASREALFISAGLEDLPAAARAFAEANSRDKWRVIPFPGAESLVVYGSSYVILESSEEESLAAWLFLRWLLQEKQDARFVEATHLFPMQISSMELLGGYQKTHPQWLQAVELMPQGIIQPQLASWRNVKTMLGDGFAHMYRVALPSGQTPAILAQMESLARELSDQP